MTIGILETGRPPESLQAQWGTYADMVRTMLGQERAYRVYDVQAGELPADPADCAAYVITGSSAGVYDELPWIAPLLETLRAIRGRAKLVGICFGHQAMAKAFGGEVTKSPKGWGLGMHRYQLVEPSPETVEPLMIAIPAFHQDQVMALPPGARVLAASEFTPYAALGYDDDTFSVQGHPEFTPEFSRSSHRRATGSLWRVGRPGPAVPPATRRRRACGRLAPRLRRRWRSRQARLSIE